MMGSKPSCSAASSSDLAIYFSCLETKRNHWVPTQGYKADDLLIPYILKNSLVRELSLYWWNIIQRIEDN